MNYTDEEFEELLTTYYKKIGSNVKKARKSKNITQMQLARILNFKAVSSISNSEICYDNHHFSLAQLYKISLVLDVHLNILVEI